MADTYIVKEPARFMNRGTRERLGLARPTTRTSKRKRIKHKQDRRV